MEGQHYQVPPGLSQKEGDGIDVPKSIEQVEKELVIDQFREIFEDLKDKRRPRDRVWDQAWAMYMGQYDWSGKADWQSKIGLPHIREIVDRAAGTFKKALLKMNHFYQIESETKLGIEKGHFTMSLMDYYLQQNDTDFINQFTDAMKSGLITSTMVFKIWWKWSTCTDPRMVDAEREHDILDPLTGQVIGSEIEKYQRVDESPYAMGTLGIQAVDPYNFWCDPVRKIYVERSVVDLSYIWHLYDQGIYKDKTAIEALTSSSEVEISKYKEQTRKGEAPGKGPNEFVREVELYHYWGNLYSRDGKILKENISYTIGNPIANAEFSVGKVELLRAPMKNGFLHKKAPYVIGTPYKVPFSTYNRGIVEDAMGIVNMIIELANSVVDGAQFEAAGGNEIDSDLLENPSQLDKGIFPGISLTTKGLENPNGKQVIRPLTVGKVPQGAIQVIQWLGKEKELATSVTSGMLGVPVNTRTSTEFNASMSSASDGLDDAARTIEETFINPTLELVAKTIYQYHNDFLMPRLAENFPQSSMLLSGMDPKERYATMMGGFQFRARGLSIFLDKMQDRQQVSEFIQGLATIPGALMQINLPAMVEEWVMTFGWNPQKVMMQPSTNQVTAPGQQQQPGIPGVDPEAMATQTPQQVQNGIQGAQMGGAANNPGNAAKPY